MVKVLIAFFLYFQGLDEVKVLVYNLKGKTAMGINTSEIAEPFVAISRDLLQKYPLGSYVYLSGCKWEGLYLVADKMGRRHKNTVDVYSISDKKAGITSCYCSAIK
jgi:3D (Asp-Asp-Asp) domain-containing protein